MIVILPPTFTVDSHLWSLRIVMRVHRWVYNERYDTTVLRCPNGSGSPFHPLARFLHNDLLLVFWSPLLLLILVSGHSKMLCSSVCVSNELQPFIYSTKSAFFLAILGHFPIVVIFIVLNSTFTVDSHTWSFHNVVKFWMSRVYTVFLDFLILVSF